MKTYIKDLEKEEKSNTYPCKNCNHGSGCYTGGKDKGGKYIEIKTCKDDGKCKEYEYYLKNLSC